jgi:hypothetical protein
LFSGLLFHACRNGRSDLKIITDTKLFWLSDDRQVSSFSCG